MFHLIYVPQPTIRNRARYDKGYGDGRGWAGHHKAKSYAGENSLLYGHGCLRHGYTDCFTCPRFEQGLDCDYDYGYEFKLRHKKVCNATMPLL